MKNNIKILKKEISKKLKYYEFEYKDYYGEFHEFHDFGDKPTEFRLLVRNTETHETYEAVWGDLVENVSTFPDEFPDEQFYGKFANKFEYIPTKFDINEEYDGHDDWYDGCEDKVCQ